MAENTPPGKGPDPRQVVQAFLEERSRARAELLAQAGLGTAVPPASEDAQVQDILARIYGGGTASAEERRFLRRQLEILSSGGHVAAPLAALSPLERLRLTAVLDVIRRAAGE